MARRRRMRILGSLPVALMLAAAPFGCDDDGSGDPGDIITGDLADGTGDTTTPDTGEPDTALDTTEPGDTTDTTEPDVTDTVDATDATDTTDTVDATDAVDTDVALGCGDGVITAGELCDGTDLDGESCDTQGFGGGDLACNATCDGFDTSGCTPLTTCGDDTIDGDDVCDGSDLGGETCESQGFDGGTLGCAATCDAFDTSACVTLTCGNGMLDAGEDCDDTDLNGASCASEGFDGGTLGCTANCVFDTTACFDCGNATVETGEVCDATDLAGESCATQGFDGGTLGCVATCDAFDTSACTTCGDATLEAGEVCDGAALGGATCESQGFDGGTLGCAATCDAFDTSACTTLTCGNGTLDAGEDCDGANLNGATCSSEGFAGGTLTCTANCTFDTTACTTCGNNVVDAGETCDGTDLAGQTCVSRGFDSGTLACGPNCGAFDTSNCARAPHPAVGEVIFTEFMANPSTLADAAGEWFELHNLSTTTTFSLNGCVIEGGGTTERIPLFGLPQMAPGAEFSFANSAMPGFTPTLTYTNFTLANSGDTLRLMCDSGAGPVGIDQVVYNSTDFTIPNGASTQLDIASFDATANNDGANWCAGQQSYNGDLGTPGAANDSCTLPTFTVGFCRLQFPEVINDEEGTPVTIYGRVYAAGLTDQTTNGNDVHPNLVAQLGYGPDNTDPAIDVTWLWAGAQPNPGFDPTAAGEPNNDEYQYTLTLPPSAGSPYDYAYRFSGDGGLTWVYCDTQAAGSSDGYQIANAGQMTTTPTTVSFDLFFSEYVEGSGTGNKALEVYNAGAGQVDLSLCTVQVYFNGAVTPGQTITLSGTVAAGATHVLCHSSAGATLAPLCNQTSSGVSFNGDDAVVLSCNSVPLDSIGQVGVDPPSGQWGTDPIATADNTIRRLCSVTSGDPVFADTFDPALEWEGFAQDTFGGLGAHTSPCPPP